MEGRRFLVIVPDAKEQANVKDICESTGYSVICVNSVYDAKAYVSALNGYHRVVIDIDPPNLLAAELCEQIKKQNEQIYIVGLRSPKNQDVSDYCKCDAYLLKPLYNCVFDMVVSKHL